MADVFVDLVAPNGVRYTQPKGLFINNTFVPSKSGATIDSINPVDQQRIISVFAAGADDVDIAVKAARAALSDPSWKSLPSSQRGSLMTELANLIDGDKKTLAAIESWDNGKPFKAALNDDLEEVIKIFRYYAGWADKIHGETTVLSGTGQSLAYTIRQPVGVVGQIIPWNFPLAMAAMKLAPALACGNTIVMKAAEQTPLSILFLATLIQKAGFPPGVVNILNGLGGVTGSSIVTHLDVDMVAFTGSTATGKEVMRLAAGTLKPILLETGGKSPLIVFDDADLEQAAKWACFGAMYNQGQICTATSRVLVHDKIMPRFMELLKQSIAIIKVGDPFHEGTSQGAQNSKLQFDKVLEYIESGKSEGATVATGGTAVPGQGLYILPTVFIDVKEDMRIWKEEIFGPVLVLKSFRGEEEAVALANNTVYGLGASIFTKDIQRAHRVAGDIAAGTIWINSSNDGDVRVPFGGMKQSGIGRELGGEGLRAYYQTKAVHINVGNIL
ncbi:aldehyde dehydrogenase [Penicillium macrosclerotiorum]|uniref:aldehyde dehydrogenase n=1 Tax=Penicillium macrosclerotiorum TaxID=303699 RepID=UPI0025499C96|nr:aldehyde dehydrogenase [Penicillium macrosclerotiorum]KAJ5673938.1 aldehyde dehydrogenase [Penicillium macrosclerotiorum]